MNTLYYGDNLDILKSYIKDETVDLIYLDPPFQSGKNYNQIFQPKDFGVKGATSQIQAFGDTWKWGEEPEKEYTELITGKLTTQKPSQKLIDLMKSMRGYLSECPLLAYLCMMAPRLLEMRRVLRDTGSIYLHCDPTASHYLKLVMDAIFGVKNFQNEIIWAYRTQGATKKRWSRKHDILLYYTKTNNWTFNYMTERSYMKHKYGFAKKDFKIDEEGRQYRDALIRDVWEISALQSATKEKIGYPTQKPEALLRRIIKASSNEGDTVLDPFCGCGTTIAVAEKTRRAWIGIDITYLAIDVIKKRLEKHHIKENEHFQVYGEPKDIYSAKKLAERNSLEFERWAVSKLNAIQTVRTGDKGVDGIINFVDYTKKDKIGKGIISVKSGQSIYPSMVRELKGTIQSQNVDFGILITIKKATKGMIEEAIKEGYFDYCYQQGTVISKIPKIQLLDIEDLFNDYIPVKLPPSVIEPYRKPDIKKEIQQETFTMKFKGVNE